ncbi:aldo/keto reductase [Labedaea rhizosphaerae]|uniref:D-threo-aldose 1-dehydrogenase n=1 Tax=Labedaea rhizosphaerae TaxID=598644 RepID=A0A4R6SB33_LABRH|nr:aldo/keto reductase [Labedaea rhizosphaerae]TDP96667.1 D-threo-aldose 1-dehydrogenase [Labedaea rhizosphaerae]
MKLGFGSAPIGNLYHAVPDDVAQRTVEAAYASGIRYFDTAPHYGLGLAEIRLGRGLAGLPRDSFQVSTKVGRLLEPVTPSGQDLDAGFDVPATAVRRWDFSADGVKRSLESSLDRLGLDRVDVVLLHDPDDHWQQAVDEAYPVLHEWRAQGVVGAIGAGMNQWQMLHRFVTETDVDAVMLAGRYTLLDRSAEARLLPACVERGVKVLAAGVFNGGMLATDTPGELFDYQPASAERVAQAKRIAEVCHEFGVSLPQAAIAFPARHQAVDSVVLGMASPEEVAANVALAAKPVPEDLWAALP